MDLINRALMHRLERFVFLFGSRMQTAKKVRIFGHPGVDLDLVAAFYFLKTLCLLTSSDLVAEDIELVHLLRDGEEEDERLANLGVVPLSDRHFEVEPGVVNILADCSDLPYLFGQDSGFPRIDFVIDHHRPSPELGDVNNRSAYLIVPEFGCASLIVYLLMSILGNSDSTVSGISLVLAAYATDTDLDGEDLSNPDLRVPVVDPTVIEFCRALYRQLLDRGQTEIYRQLAEERWQTEEFQQILQDALDHSVVVRSPELTELLTGSRPDGNDACAIRIVELPNVPFVHWVGKLAAMLLRLGSGKLAATIVRVRQVDGRTVSSVRTGGALDANVVVQKIEGGGGGRFTAAGYTRPASTKLPWAMPADGNRTQRLLAGIIHFLKTEG